MNSKFHRILLAMLLIWVPLAFYVRSADGFTLVKELAGLLAVIYIVLLTLMKGSSVYRQPLVIITLLFTVWMVADSYGVSLVPVPEELLTNGCCIGYWGREPFCPFTDFFKFWEWISTIGPPALTPELSPHWATRIIWADI
jgi:hypothetical protein